ncbi:MAG: tRNA-specific adenosine deaminase [Sphingobacteriales bacterium]|nr:MAG: tRNA-specific adenosine deaminase [Sphingobacteriales bacterium]
MQQALEQARIAGIQGEVPVGAILVSQGEVIGRGANCPIGQCDPTAHAEIQALRAAGRFTGNYRLVESILYVTIEPCAMCWGALVHGRVAEVVYAAAEPKAGVVSTQAHWLNSGWGNHRVLIRQGPCADEASELMQSFFAERRERKKQLKSLGPSE